MKSQEWKWGLFIGSVNVIWLLVSWLLGWHGSGIGLFQVAIVLGFFLSFVGYVIAFRSMAKAEPETTFAEGIRTGAVIAAISGLLTSAGWAFYLTTCNPGMSDYLVSEVRAYFTAAGTAPEQIELIAAESESDFGLRAFTIKGGVGAFVFGIIYSAIMMGWFKWQQRR